MAIFALDLDHDGIRLLREAGGDWDVVDHVALDDRKLAGRLRRMRHTAVLATDANLETILIIPNWQILYTTLSLPSDGLPPDEAWIAASLDGMTGCPVEEMKFDWRTTPEGVHVAALDVNTLDEAESFATQHGFNPVRFSARPAVGDFPDMPDFGPTEFVRHRAAQDRAFLFESQRAPEATNAFADIAEPTPELTFSSSRQDTLDAPSVGFESSRREEEVAPAPLEPGPLVQSDAPAAPLPITDAVEPVELRSEPDETILARTAPRLAPQEAASAPAIHTTAPTAPIAPALDEDAAALPSALDAAALSRTPAVLSELTFETLPDIDETAPVLTVATEPEADESVEAPVDEVDDVAEAAASQTEVDDAKEAAVEPTEAEDAAEELEDVASDPAEDQVEEVAADAVEPEADEVEDAADPEPAVVVTPVSPPPIEISAIQPTAPRLQPIPGAHRDRRSSDPETVRRGPSALRLEPQEPKPTDWRTIGLTTGAAASIIAVLVWTALTLVSPEDDLAVIAARGLPNPVATPETPEAPSANGALNPPISRLVPDVETVSFDPTAPVTDRSEINDRRMVALGQEPSQADDVDPSSTARAFDVWMTPPPAPPDPVGDTIDRLYLAAIDPAIPLDDALALPEAQLDLAVPTIPSSPPAPGQQFDFDDQGFVRATPDGAQTPDGVTVYAALPTVLPPSRPVENAEPEVEAPSALAGRLPRLRPADLVERNERTQWGGRTLQELAGLRPETRPTSVQDRSLSQNASLVPSEFAINTSRKPPSRPTDFQAVVAAAQARASAAANRVTAAVAAPVATPQPQVAEPAAPSAAPDIPTTASVARQATISNAINLRRVNLIGVYGSASSRRALVRLPSGRYRKVQVGDSVDGGRVRQISEGRLVYTKGGRDVTLTVPSG